MGFKLKKYLSNFLNKNESEVPLIDRLEDLIESEQSLAQNEAADDSGELALVSNVLGLKDLTAADVMVPRADIVAAKVDTTLDEFIDIFSQSHFSQIPIYNNTLDDIVGIVRAMDFIPYIKNPDSFCLTPLLKDVIYVVPSIQLLELLLEIKSSVNHMALVVDELGGVDGLVTLQDVVSEIVGEIQQSRDIFPQFIARQDGSFLADAKMLVTECEEMLDVDLIKPFVTEGEEPDVETLGGLTMLLAGRMPTRGETLVHPSGVEFEIADADPRRVKRIIVRKPQSESL
jgi:CBS domain containing-hemolysin-like protein